MEAHFAAIWACDGDGCTHAGDLELADGAVLLHDVIAPNAHDGSLAITELAAVHLADSDAELGDWSTIVVDLFDGRRIRIVALGRGETFELAAQLLDRLALARPNARRAG